MNDNYEQMLDVCFEIEGLLSLMIKREDDVPERVEALLKHKVACLSQFCGMVDSEDDKLVQNTELEESENANLPESKDVPMVEDEHASVNIESACDTTVDIVANVAKSENMADSTINDKPESIALTLNDKFRFRRELFGNNAAELSDALDVVNAVNSQAELDDYFYNDLCWDPENPDVKDFMAIASARFNK
ncbi:MAG: hypothetical protein K2O88_10385 [Paramuribaculum sp.]|nr:hypothetical protein [Paramuribaculum sp.]